jgi:hypothetical protein
MLAEILPTSYEVGALNGQVRPVQPEHLVVVGEAPARRQAALSLGADIALDADALRVVLYRAQHH